MIDNLRNMSTQAMSQPTSTKIKMSLVMCLCWYLLFTSVDGRATDPAEVKALRSIKESLNDPYGNLIRWNKKDPCTSNWRGIVCHNRTLDGGYLPLDDGYLHVKELSLLHKNLSGTLSPDVSRLSHLTKLDIMWNNISGTIPREIGLITTLELLLLNGNHLTGSLPDELSNLLNLNRLQIDENQISGPIPPSFANMKKVKHIHMNNNSLNGQIPSELSQLPTLIHLLLDNNNLSGALPPELANLSSLQILQLDNNNFGGSTIPPSYGSMSTLLKLSLRNCSLRGPIPDWSNMSNIAYIDLSRNQLNESIPTGRLSEDITTINLSRNNLTGDVPDSFSRLPLLQKLSLEKNSLSGSIPSIIWQNRNLKSTDSLILDFRYNQFSNISGSLRVQANVTVRLRGNPICSNISIVNLCGTDDKDFDNTLNFTNPIICHEACPPPYEHAPPSPAFRCFCAAPLYIGYRLKSPGFSNLVPYVDYFREYLSSSLQLNVSQLAFDSVAEGPRLRMYLKIFPPYVNNSVRIFNTNEVFRIRDMFGGWKFPPNNVCGPYEFLDFTPSKPYDEFPNSRSGLSKGALAGVILGTIAGSVTLSAFVSLLIFRRHTKKYHKYSKRRRSTRISTKIDGVKGFTYNEMAMATNNFNNSTIVGQGGYGKVYRGVLADGTIVAIKCAEEGSLQGEKEFLTEIELLSRLHHRNLVSLLGYCDEEGDQMLVYEFMPNGNLRDHLSGKFKVPMSFAMRANIALGSARGILYLHTEANPPIFHRDIKATNILLDSKFTAKVADFGLSRLAPVPELEGDVPSHVSTVVKGTPGYLDPEYFLTRKLTDKSDVYSLGVVFLEMLTGMHPISHGKNIVREVNTAYRFGMIFSILDEQMGSFPSECVEKFVGLALKCCQDQTESRPSMSEVVRELENIRLMMPKWDSNLGELMTTDSSGKVVSSPSSSSSSLLKPYVSQDVSGSDLVSGVMPTVAPR